MLRTSTSTAALAICISAVLCNTSIGAPRSAKSQAPTEDMKSIIAYNELDEPARTWHVAATTPKLHKRKLKLHAHHLHKRHLIKQKPARLVATGDTPQPLPTPSYTDSSHTFFDGPYAGIAAGVQKTSVADEPNPYGAIAPYRPYPSLSSSFAAGVWGFAGFNYPIGIIVAGVEGDAGYSNPYGTLAGVEGSLRARLGVAIIDGVMIYGTSGVMIADAPLTNQNSGVIRTGWIAGGGVEAFITPEFSLRAELLRSQGVSGNLDTTTIRTGIAVKF